MAANYSIVGQYHDLFIHGKIWIFLKHKGKFVIQEVWVTIIYNGPFGAFKKNTDNSWKQSQKHRKWGLKNNQEQFYL